MTGIVFCVVKLEMLSCAILAGVFTIQCAYWSKGRIPLHLYAKCAR